MQHLPRAITLPRSAACSRIVVSPATWSTRADATINPDIHCTGGISEGRRIGAPAHLHGILFRSQIGTETALKRAASVDGGAHLPGTVIMKGRITLEEPFGDKLLFEPLEA